MLQSMRRFFLSLLLLLVSTYLFSSSFGFAIDAISLDSIFVESKGARIDAYYNLTEDVRLNMLIGFSAINKTEIQLNALELGFSMDYFPFEKASAYLGTSIVRTNILFGFDAPKENLCFVTDVRFGYQIKIKNFYIEPRITITDLSAFSSGENEILSQNFYQYSRYRFSLFLGYLL